MNYGRPLWGRSSGKRKGERAAHISNKTESAGFNWLNYYQLPHILPGAGLLCPKTWNFNYYISQVWCVCVPGSFRSFWSTATGFAPIAACFRRLSHSPSSRICVKVEWFMVFLVFLLERRGGGRPGTCGLAWPAGVTLWGPFRVCGKWPELVCIQIVSEIF